STRDWSSDVCSSDLGARGNNEEQALRLKAFYERPSATHKKIVRLCASRFHIGNPRLSPRDQHIHVTRKVFVRIGTWPASFFDLRSEERRVGKEGMAR